MDANVEQDDFLLCDKQRNGNPVIMPDLDAYLPSASLRSKATGKPSRFINSTANR
jgi:hypothetical protein